MQNIQKKIPKRALNGVLILNKPQGFTSNQALQKARWLFNAAKGGHTGSLDPLATGVLPLCFGEATKFSQFLLDADKIYRSTITFGKRSATGDCEGELISDTGAPGLSLEDIEAVLPRFRGDIEQVPPMFSALKHQGQPLYKLARAGLEVDREARKVHIFRLEVLNFRPHPKYPELDIEVECSKGTYIRSLAMDIGDLLFNKEGHACGALISALHRSQVSTFTEHEAVNLSALEAERGNLDPGILDHHLLPVERAIVHLRAVILSENTGYYFQQGQPVLVGSALKNTRVGETVRVSLDSGKFLGVAEILDDGRVAPRRLIVQQ
jgi:tRNA pseudouridine55 synthase